MSKAINIRPFVENDYLAIINYCLSESQAIYTSLPKNVIGAFKKDKYNQPFVISFDDYLIGFFALYTHNTGNIYTDNEHAIIFKSFSIDSRYQKRGCYLPLP